MNLAAEVAGPTDCLLIVERDPQADEPDYTTQAAGTMREVRSAVIDCLRSAVGMQRASA